MSSLRINELAVRYGTPLYVYQLDIVRAAATGLLGTLPEGVGLYYSVKANPHPALVGALAGLGLGVEISSAGELDVVRTCGVEPSRCLYTGPAKTVAELSAAVGAGVGLFSVESTVDLHRLAAAADRPVDFLIRLNAPGSPGPSGLRMTGTATQFGVGLDTLDPGSPLVSSAGLARPRGVHVYSASNIVDEPALLGELMANLAAAVAAAERTRFTPELVDLGGGFAAPFAVAGKRPAYPSLRDRLAAELDATLPGWRRGEPAVVVESGRHLVAEAGTLLTTVMDRKVSGGRSYVLCDAGVNVLGGMSGLGRLLPPGAQPGGQSARAEPAVLAGPLCTPLDVLSRSARLDQLAIGDVLAIPNVGAYGLTASLVAFLGRPLPVEVVLDDDEVVGARQLRLVGSAVDRIEAPK